MTNEKSRSEIVAEMAEHELYPDPDTLDDMAQAYEEKNATSN